MKILDVEQGSPAWLAARASYRCASEAPIIMGASRFMTRAELIRLKATGGEKEFSDYVRKRVLEKGHEAERAGLELFGRKIGDELYPVTAVDDTETYLASFDGMTMAEDIAAEHKLWSPELEKQIEANDLEPAYFWQLEHQAIVRGGDTAIAFVISDEKATKQLEMMYVSRAERRAALVAAWDQFDEDVANYQHVEATPTPAAAVVESLPALSIRVEGALALVSNLDAFTQKLRAFIDGLNPKPSTDQDFANAEAAIKVFERAEQALKAAEDSALAQTSSVEEMRRAVAMNLELARSNRLVYQKLVAARKESIRAEIVQGGRDAFARHIDGLNVRLGRPYMPQILTDFAGAAKGKKTVQSLRDAVEGELSRTKLAANAVADGIQLNLRRFTELAKGNEHQFPDLATLVLKATDDFAPFVSQRIAANKDAEVKRLEGEREKIRAEEAEKAKKAAQATVDEMRRADVASGRGVDLTGQQPPATAHPAEAGIRERQGAEQNAATGSARKGSPQASGAAVRLPTEEMVAQLEAALTRLRELIHRADAAPWQGITQAYLLQNPVLASYVKLCTAVELEWDTLVNSGVPF